MKKSGLVIGGVVLGALLGCSDPESTAGTDAATEAADIEEPGAGAEPLVFTHLETREHKLTLLMGEEGPLYTVSKKEGEVLAERIDDATLGRDYPELHRMVHRAADGDGPYLEIGDVDY